MEDPPPDKGKRVRLPRILIRRSRNLPLLSFMCGLFLVLSGCGTSSPAPTPNDAATAAEILQRASSRLAEIPSAHFTLSVEGETYVDTAGAIRLVGAEGDLVRPDKVSVQFQAEIVGRTITIQLITIGESSWTTNILTGDWEPAPLEFTYRPDILFSTQEGIGPVMGAVTDAHRLEDTDVAGRAVYHIQGTVEQELVGPLTYYSMRGSPVSVNLWIDRQTSDLLRAQLAEPPSDERPSPAIWTLDLSHHGDEFVINPPVTSVQATP